MDQNDKNKSNSSDVSSKRKISIIFVAKSFVALLLVGLSAYFILSKIKNDKLSNPVSQDQFEGTAEVSSQLQIECQKSAVKISEQKDIAAIETEYRQNAENCKDVYFVLESEGSFRKEGMYADLVVDIAKIISKSNNPKAVELLQFAKKIKPWDFYLGPVSCDSQHVLDAYIESFSTEEQKTCIKQADLKTLVIPELQNKNFSILSKMVLPQDVVWMGIPESDVGCPEKISSVLQSLKKLTSGSIVVDDKQPDTNENSTLNINIKLSDTESIALIFSQKQECLNLSSILIPNLEISE